MVVYDTYQTALARLMRTTASPGNCSSFLFADGNHVLIQSAERKHRTFPLHTMLFCVLFRFWIIRSDAKRRETYNYTGEALYGPFARAPAPACITEPWNRVTTLDGERPSNRLPRYSRLAVVYVLDVRGPRTGIVVERTSCWCLTDLRMSRFRVLVVRNEQCC